MPALASFVDDAAGAVTAPFPPGYPVLAGDCSLPPPSPLSPDPIAPPVSPSDWSPSLSASLYKVDGWGAPYFSVNGNGNISARPFGHATLPHQEIDLMKVVRKVSDPKSFGGLGIPLPVIVRLPDVLRHRLESLQLAFDSAIRFQGYESHYQGVFPVKCNQDRFVVEDIVRFGSGFRFGLEAGSKPELLLAMSCLCKGSPDSFLICNGYKDAEYVSLALMARKLNLNTVIVLEQEEELDTVIDVSSRIGVRPVIGLRAKLRTKHSGHFGSTSGEKGKFGLTTTQILRVVRKLEKFQMLDCLQLLHFHIGSQIPSTVLLADGVAEAAQIYCELERLGAAMHVIDIGGGLGIDYDGTRSAASDSSVGYGLEEYAAAVVQAVSYVCDRKFVKHPVICSESGRALVSHHSILIFEAISSSVPMAPPASLDLAYFIEQLADEALSDYENMKTSAIRGEYNTCLVYAEQLKQRCVDQFKEGSLGLEHLADVDAICEAVAKAIWASDSVRTYHVNLSVFASVPDLWAIGQLFPILPIHRLDERPGVKGVLSDLTCDSDGKIDKFIGGESSLLLHELKGGVGSGSGGGGGSSSQGYYLGMFLGGAYQEALGGLHNLFGGPSVVRVSQSDGPHSFAVTRAVPGPACADVLRVMQHEPELMFETLKRRADEYGDSVEAIVAGLARAFHSMPYLADAAMIGNAGYWMSGRDDAGVGEDEWAYCCA